MNIPTAAQDDLATQHPLVLSACESYESTPLEGEVIAFGIYREVSVLLRQDIQPGGSPLHRWAFAAKAYGEKLSCRSLDTCFAISHEISGVQRAKLEIICDKYFRALPPLDDERFIRGLRSWYADTHVNREPSRGVNADHHRVLIVFGCAMWVTIWQAIRRHRSYSYVQHVRPLSTSVSAHGRSSTYESGSGIGMSSTYAPTWGLHCPSPIKITMGVRVATPR